MPLPVSDRRWELDALRGLMLVLMTLTHMPTMYSLPLGQPLGFVSAAEGFVLLSACLAGRVYGARARRHGVGALQTACHDRALTLYLCHVGLLALAFTAIAWFGVANHQGGVTGMLEFYLADPARAVRAALLLWYSPPLLDILPLYIGLMLLTPWVWRAAQRWGWGTVLAVSALLWLAQQAGAGARVYAVLSDGLPWAVPYERMGSFHGLAWQLLWVAGFWLGSRTQPLPAVPRGLAWPALAVVVAMLAWRHVAGQDPMPGVAAVAALLDKWSLGPWRLLNLAAWVVVLLAWGPRLARLLPRPRPLELLGRQSLPVFVAHLVIVMLTLAFFGSPEVVRPWTTDLGLLAAAFAGLCGVALWREKAERSAAGGRWLSGAQVR